MIFLEANLNWTYMKGVQAEAQTCAYRNTSVRRLALYRMARFLDIKIAMILGFWYASIWSYIDVRFIMSNVLNHDGLFRNGTFFKFIRYPNCVFLDAICNLLILAKPAKRLFKNENMNLSYPHVWYSACMLWLRNELLPYMLLRNYFCRCISWDIQLQHSKINHLTRFCCIYF